MSLNLPQGVQVTGPIKPGYESILTHDALALVAKLHRAFEARRQELLKARVARQARICLLYTSRCIEGTHSIPIIVARCAWLSIVPPLFKLPPP